MNDSAPEDDQNVSALPPGSTENTESTDSAALLGQLRRSEERLRLSLQNTNVFLWEVNLQTGEAEYSANVAEVLGYALPAEAAGVFAAIHPEDRDLVMESVTRARSGEARLDIEHRIVNPDTGEILWVRAQGQRIERPSDGTPYFLGITLNITDRKRSEALLRESGERLRVLIENLPGAAIFIVDRDLRYVFAEGKVLSFLGYRTEDLIGKSVFELFPPEEAAVLSRDYRASFAGETFAREHEVKDRSFISRGVPLYSSDGDVYAVLAVSFDITERRDAEEELRTSEERLRIAVEAAELGTWDWNLQTDEVVWNERHFRMLGLEPRPGPVSPEDFFRHVHEEDAGWLQARLREAAANGTIFHTEFRALVASEVVRWMEGYGRVVEGREEKPRRMSGAMRDITDRKQAEMTVRSSVERFRTLADAVPQIIWTSGAEGRAVYFNRRWYDYTGLTYEESAGMAWRTTVHPDDVPLMTRRWQRSLETGKTFEAEYRLRQADGVYRWFLVRSVPLRDNEGKITSWFGTATDIEDRRQSEVSLRTSEERFRLLVEGAKEYAMFLLDRNGQITFWSAGAERVFGWRESEVLGKEADLLFTPEDRALGVCAEELRTAQAAGQASDRRWHVRKDGSRFWADGILMRLEHQGGSLRGFAKILRDATEDKRAEEAIRQANEVLEARVVERTRALAQRTEELTRMSELRQELLRRLVNVQEEERGRISRDLHDDTGQVVTALLLGLENLKNAPSVAADPEAMERLRHLQSLAGEVAQKSHQLSFTLRPTDLDDIGLIGALRNYTEQWSRWSGLPVELETVGLQPSEGNGPRLPREIETTIYRVTQEALTNVLRHAILAPEEDGKALGKVQRPKKRSATGVSVLLQRKAKSREVLTIIEDDGPGFNTDFVLNLRPAPRRLGIFGMQERARLAGGTLTIESEPGKGTTVFMRLPLPD